MGDFTLTGFVVDCYQEALALLKSTGYRLIGEEICINTELRRPEIKALLTANNIRNTGK